MIMYSSLAEWSSCANFDRSHNRFATIFNFDPIWALLGPKRALLGPLGARKRPNTRSKCLVTMIPTRSDQLAAVGTKSGPPGPSGSLWGPQKALSGPKRALLGALGARKRPNTRSKCLVTMIPTRSDQLAAVGTKSGPPGPSGSLWGPQKALSGPKRALLGALECRKGLLRGPRM